MTNPTRKQLNKLADKWLKGTISPQEKEMLDRWYDVDSTEPINWPGKEGSEEELSARLLSRINKKKASYPFKRKWQIPAAAVLLISLSVTGYLYFSGHALSNHQSSVAGIISPGKYQAVLTLGNGQKINLTDAASGQLAMQAGTSINKTAQGELIYAASNTLADNHAAPLFNTIEAPVGGQWQVILPDGSQVWLNASSSLTYPTTFTGKYRKVTLKGEAYFEVAHNKAMPFKVSSGAQTVEVLGTHFNIMAYADEQAIKTTLLEGSVKISDHRNSKILTPGEQAQASSTGLNVTDNTDVEDAVAWKNGYFKFNENLTGIMKKIARWYNVDVIYETTPDPNLAFGGKISRSRDIIEVLKIMEYTGKVHFKIEGRRIIVRK